jgi:hypothetical protein
MTGMEDRARAAMQAIAITIDDAPPLPLSPAPEAVPRRDRRWRTWITPVMAAVAMLAVGLSVAIVRGAMDRRAAPAAVTGLPDGVPRYYMALGTPISRGTTDSATVVVGDTMTGKKLFTVGPFAGGDAAGVTAAADDRTFVVATEYMPGFGTTWPPGPQVWYLIRVTPGSRPGYTVRELPIHLSPGSYYSAMALSPDGSRLALAGPLQAATAPGPAQTLLRIYSVATGDVLDTWTQTLPEGSSKTPVGSLTWTDGGRQLALAYQSGAQNYIEVRLLTVTRLGHTLLADSRFIWSTQPPAHGGQASSPKSPLSCANFAADVLVTADGKTIVCAATGVFRDPGKLPAGTCPTVPPWNDEAIIEYSTATGEPTPLYSFDTNCVPYVSAAATGLLWASPAGDTVIGSFEFTTYPYTKTIVRFGIFREDMFRPLPVPPTTAIGTVAW